MSATTEHETGRGLLPETFREQVFHDLIALRDLAEAVGTPERPVTLRTVYLWCKAGLPTVAIHNRRYAIASQAIPWLRSHGRDLTAARTPTEAAPRKQGRPRKSESAEALAD